VTTEAPVHGIQVARVEPSWGADTTPAQINFWLYAEDALDFQVCGFPGVPMKVAGGPVGEPVGVFSFGPSLETIGGVNGLPVSLHAGHLLIGNSDFGPIESHDTVEFTQQGLLVSGAYRGSLPEPKHFVGLPNQPLQPTGRGAAGSTP